MDYHAKYGKIILSKGTILYHWSNIHLSNLSNNLFLCLSNSIWDDNNKILHKYKLKKDIELILTIKNDSIINDRTYSSKNKRQDSELLTTIYADITNETYRGDDVNLKTNNTYFSKFCGELFNANYKGLFNFIDSDEGRFEIVIFNPTEYLDLMEQTNHAIVKLHKIEHCKRIMLSKKINCTYPYEFEYTDINRPQYGYPSIFYYIYKKVNQ